MKILICGDLHIHFNILEQVKKLIPSYDKVVFLGDYVDDWDAIPEASYNIVNQLIELKKQDPDKIILLLGNHCLSEWQAGIFRCSGFNERTHQLVKSLFNQNEDLFDIAYSYDNIFFAHAGLTTSWCNKYLKDFQLSTSEDYANILNLALHQRNNDQKYEAIFNALSGVGSMRGGWDVPSPIWADTDELLAELIPIDQVVGHTPQETVTRYQIDNHTIYFCDTHSDYSNGYPIGDNTLLEIDEGKFSKISIDGEHLEW